MKKTFLFDFDGTLVDSMPTYVSSALKVLDDEGIAYGEDIVKIITPLGFKGAAEYFINTYDLPMTVDEVVEKMRDGMLYAYTHEIDAKRTVIDTLYKLKERGFDLNVLTASPHITLDACLKRLGIYDLFTNVWSCEDFGTTKADTQIYVDCAKRLGVNVSNVIFLDDNYDADSTAKRAGATVIGVYDEYSSDYIEDMKELCDGFIYSFEELLNYDL